MLVFSIISHPKVTQKNMEYYNGHCGRQNPKIVQDASPLVCTPCIAPRTCERDSHVKGQEGIATPVIRICCGTVDFKI